MTPLAKLRLISNISYISILDISIAIPFILSQKNETDWEFLKRIAAQYGKQLFVDARVDKMQIAIGEPQLSNTPEIRYA